MIKALVKIAEEKVGDTLIITDYVIYSYDEELQTVLAQPVRRAVLNVSEEVGQAGGSMVADQKEKVVTLSRAMPCYTFLDLIGNRNKEGKLTDIREVA